MTNNAIIKNAYKTYMPFHPLNNPEVDVWTKLIENPVDNEEKFIDDKELFIFEILTEEIISYDYEYFVNHSDKSYTPVSYTFITTIPKNSLESEHIQNFMHQQNNSYIKCTLKLINSTPSQKECRINGNLVFGCNLPINSKNNEILPAVTEAALCWEQNTTPRTSASGSPAKINFTLNAINHDLNNPNATTEHHESNNSESTPSKFTYVRIYNVGAANTVCIKHKNGKTILFDCGCESNIVNSLTTPAVNLIKKLRPNVIIISHWHTDHYNLLPYLDTSALEYVIFTDYSNCPDAIKKTIASLKRNGTKIITGSFSPDYLINLGYFDVHIFKGNGLIPNNTSCGNISYDNSINDTALILAIGNSTLKFGAILPSDVSYFSWPNNLLKCIQNIKVLVAPHHGGCVYTTANPPQNFNKYKTVIISNSSIYKPITEINKNHNKTYLEKIMQLPAMKFKYTCDKNTTHRPYIYFKIS